MRVRLCFLALFVVAGCGGDDDSPAACTSASECAASETCIDGRCAPRTGIDAGDDASDSGTDVGTDACSVTCGATCCDDGQRCNATMECVADLGPCEDDGDCLDDSYCDEGRCTPYGTGPRGETNEACMREPEPGRFQPTVQCRWDTPAEGDPAPLFREVENTPLVVDFGIGRGPDDPVRPSIVFITARNFTAGSGSFVYGDRGILRVIDGRTCEDQGVLAELEDRVGGATTPTLGDLDGDGVPEIVAKSGEGGLIAFEYRDGSFQRRWFSTREGGARDRIGGTRAIPSLSMHDLDDDGLPEIIMGAIVYSADGVLLDESLGLRPVIATYNAPPVVADIDHDGDAELVAGDGVFDWDIAGTTWVARTFPAGMRDGFVAVADFGDFPDATGNFEGGPEIAIIAAGQARVQSIGGTVVFGPVARPGGSYGGNLTVADFDGDGRAEFAAGGPGSLTAFDLDCRAESVGTCASGRNDGILWSKPVRDFSGGINGSSVFDFEGDGTSELVYADECFLRVFAGPDGKVVWSAPRSSGTWIEGPIVVDADGDFNAEIVVGSNSGHGACPPIDPLHEGLRCEDASDCAEGATCGDGFCRCGNDEQCGDIEAYQCTTPLPETGSGNVCRARFTDSIVGVRVYADASDRWVSSRRVWNQHAYAVTHVNENGTIPRTSEVTRNWSTPVLNDFQKDVQGNLAPLAGPDHTIGRGSFDRTCTPAAPIIPLRASVCNRGAEPVDSGMVATFYQGDPREDGTRICSVTTERTLNAGACEEVACDWDPAPTEGMFDIFLFVDEEDDNVECVEDNNIAQIGDVGCLLI